MRKIELKRSPSFEADNRRKQQEKKAVSSSAVDAILATSAASYTSMAESFSVTENAVPGVVAGQTYSRKFGMTGGASKEVESRSLPVRTVASSFRTGTQQLKTLVYVHGGNGQVSELSLRLWGVGTQSPQSAAGERKPKSDTENIDSCLTEEHIWFHLLNFRFRQGD